MNKIIVIVFLTVFLIGCAPKQEIPLNPMPVAENIMNAEELTLNSEDLQDLGMSANSTKCQNEQYETGPQSPLAQYSFCNYYIDEHENTEVVLEVKKFTNANDLKGSYQYESLHLRGLQGIISEDTYGDYSRFYVNNESTTYYYHLWMVKDNFLIHITSKGIEEDGEYIERIGEQILLKFY